MVLNRAVNPFVRASLIAIVISLALRSPLNTSAEDLTKQAGISLREVSNDFSEPVAIRADPRDSGTLIVAERSGLILTLDIKTGRTQKIIDIEGLLGDSSPRGLLSIATYGSDGAQSLFVSYLDPQGDLVVGRFALATTPKPLDEESMAVVIKIARLSVNSLGSGMDFGPDGALYIGTNDGEGTNTSRTHTAQMPQNLLGKIIRIKPGDRAGYSVPEDNPFKSNPNSVQQLGQSEIWALGLRDPEALQFDSATKKLVVLDSNERTEEINLVEPGKNYGWDKQDGDDCLVKDCSNQCLVKPITTLPKSSANSHLVGGIPYHRDIYPELRDTIIFAETTTATIYSTKIADGKKADPSPIWVRKTILQLPKGAVTALGEGLNGALYIASDRGAIFELVP
jgi:glucose/arabinose dehydrogenase